MFLFVLCLCRQNLLFTAFVLFIVNTSELGEARLPSADTKPYETLEDFWPFYLSEHSNTICRRLHVLGCVQHSAPPSPSSACV